MRQIGTISVLLGCIAVFAAGYAMAVPSGAEIAALVDQLISSNSPPRIDGPDTEYSTGFDKAAQIRVFDAFKKLSKIGLPAFPYLHARLSDKRYCLTEDMGPADQNFSVGDVCHLIIEGHLQPWDRYVKGAKQADGHHRAHPCRPNYFRGHELDRPKAFGSWWKTHKDKSMREVQIEVVQWVIAQEKRKPNIYPDDEIQTLKTVLAEIRKSDKPFAPPFPFVR